MQHISMCCDVLSGVRGHAEIQSWRHLILNSAHSLVDREEKIVCEAMSTVFIHIFKLLTFSSSHITQKLIGCFQNSAKLKLFWKNLCHP